MSVEKFSEIARLATELVLEVGQFRSAHANGAMKLRVELHANRIANLSPNFGPELDKLKDAARLFFGEDGNAARKYVGGDAALHGSMMGALRAIVKRATKRAGEARLGTTTVHRPEGIPRDEY